MKIALVDCGLVVIMSCGIGCGGGVAKSDRKNTHITDPGPYVPPDVVIPPVGSTLTHVTLHEINGAAAPLGVVTFAQAFPKGHVPESVVVTAGNNAVATQVDVKRRYDDGSVRHAVLSVAI